jgi:agmatinase
MTSPAPVAPVPRLIGPESLFLSARPGVWEAAAGRKGPSSPVAILGVPLDRTTTYRPGAAAGPAEIRTASFSLETYSPDLDAELPEEAIFDFGDVAPETGRSLEGDLRAIEDAAAGLAERGFLPVFLGGEHLLTLATYRGAARAVAARLSPSDQGGSASRASGSAPAQMASPSPVFLHFDAHADLRETYEGATLSHATVARHVAALAGAGQVFQFGIRSGERQEMLWGRANVNRIPGPLDRAVAEALRQTAGRQVYLSVDIDIFDPSHAPGTGNPEPGGPPASEVFAAVVAVGQAAARGPAGGGIDLVGFDLVEVSPPLDPSGRTVVLAAKLIREFLIARGVRPVQGE